MLSENLKIEIRPVPNRGGIRDFSENLEYFSQAHIIAPFVNPVTFKYETGLSEEDVKYLKDKQFPYNIDDTYMKGVPHEFWENSVVKVELKSAPMFLYPGKNLIDFIKYKYLLVNSYMYKSEEEMLTGRKPLATHYIYDEVQATEISATRIEKANKLARQVADLPISRKRDILMILLDESVEHRTESYITVKFKEILENKDMSKNLEEILSHSKEKLALMAEVKSCIQQNVLRRTKKGIFFFETNLGFTEADVVDFLSKEENQEIYLNIKSKI